MSVEVINETEWVIEPKLFSDLGLWVLDQMQVSTDSEVNITFIEPEPMAQLHEEWMDLLGPTDVMSFPMDELRPGEPGNIPEGILGDIVLSPDVAAQQALVAGHSTAQELMLLTIHGMLHLLGYDHIEKSDERLMFAMQRQLLLTFLAQRPGSAPDIVLPESATDLLAQYDREHREETENIGRTSAQVHRLTDDEE